MALSFTNTTGNLFNRLGRLFGTMAAACGWQKTTLPTEITGVNGQYAANPGYVPTLQASLTAAQNANAQIKNDMQTVAVNTLVGMVNADTPLPTLTTPVAMQKLIADMLAAPASVKANTVTASVAAAGANLGNSVCVVDITRPSDGRKLEDVYAENVLITCVADSQPGTGGTTVGSELWQAQGQAAAGRLDFNWPTGSGGTTRIPASNASDYAGTANLLTNGDFENFVVNVPTGWNIINGIAGTQVMSTATAYRGALALDLVGASSVRTRISQTLRDTANAVVGNIRPQTKYCIGVWVRVSTVPAAGTLRIALRDGTGDGAAVISGQSVTITLSGATTSYVFYSAVLNVPAILPDFIALVIEETVAIDDAKSIYIDDLVLAPMVQHQNGPYFAVFPGATKAIKGDVFNATIGNAYNGLLQTWFHRTFSMDSMGMLLPSDYLGAETIPDSLIS